MALWGKTDGAALSGSITTVSANSTISGANTAFTEELSIEDTLIIGANKYVVASITDDDTATIRPAALASTTDVTPQVSTSPKYLSDIEARTEVSLVTTDEAQDRINGVKTPGWTIYKEYGTGRKRIETLVALKS